MSTEFQSVCFAFKQDESKASYKGMGAAVK